MEELSETKVELGEVVVVETAAQLVVVFVLFFDQISKIKCVAVDSSCKRVDDLQYFRRLLLERNADGGVLQFLEVLVDELSLFSVVENAYQVVINFVLTHSNPIKNEG